MSLPAKQIGWSQEANLMYNILRQLDIINKTFGKGVAPSQTQASSIDNGTTTTTITTEPSGDNSGVPPIPL